MTSPYVWLFLQINFGFICALIAQKKSRNPYAWFLFGLFFSFLALIALLILPPLDTKETKKENNLELTENLKEIQELETTEQNEEELPSDVANKLWYYLDENDNRLGPMTIKALINDWDDKKIKEDTFVWNEEMSDWKPLKETSDFKFFR